MKHGPECPLEKLDFHVSRHPLLQRVIRLFGLTSVPGFSFTMDDINVEEAEALVIYKRECDKYQKEQMKNASSKPRG